MGIISKHLHIQLNAAEIKKIWRLRTQSGSNPTPILLALSSERRRREILHAAYKFKGNNIYCSQVVIKKALKEKAVLLSHRQIARNKGLSAFIKNNRLIINGDSYTSEQLQDETQRVDETEGQRENNEKEVVHMYPHPVYPRQIQSCI